MQGRLFYRKNGVVGRMCVGVGWFVPRMCFWVLIGVLVQACGGGADEEDSSPDAFYFTDEEDAPLAQWVEADALEISGLNSAAEISVAGGEYSINYGAFTDEAGEVENEDVVVVRLFSADTIDTETELTLTIGDKDDTFVVTTAEVVLRAKDAFKKLTFSWDAVSGADYYQLLEKPHAGEDFTQVGRDLESTSTGITLDVPIHRLDWLNAEYKLQTCTNAECSVSDEISVYEYMQRSIGYIKASNPESHDRFGRVALSADGNTLAVAAAGEDGAAKGVNGDDGNNASSGSGAVFVYVRDNGEWRFQAYIKASNTGEADAFGYSLALSDDGNTLAVGAPYEDSRSAGVEQDPLNDDLEDSGAVYVFRRAGDAWEQQNYIKASAPAANDHFGMAIALSAYGGTLAVGATGQDSDAVLINGEAAGTLENSGAVYLYALLGDNWEEQAFIKASNTGAGDMFGSSLALSANGNTLAVGAPYEESVVSVDPADNSLVNAGAVYVYRRSGNDWRYERALKARNAQRDARYGSSVAISASGSVLAVGAPGEASIAIGVDGDELDRSNPESGAAYVYSLEGDSWVQQAYVKSSNGDVGDLFGLSVALSGSGDLLVVGAPGESSAAEAVSGQQSDNSATDAGAAYAFELEAGAWSQVKYVKASNTNAADGFGRWLSLDASGDVLAVGAPDEGSSSTLFSDLQASNALTSAGAVYLY